MTRNNREAIERLAGRAWRMSMTFQTFTMHMTSCRYGHLFLTGFFPCYTRDDDSYVAVYERDDNRVRAIFVDFNGVLRFTSLESVEG